MENVAVLEPALPETVAATLCLALREGTDRAMAMGFPEDAARDLVPGRLKMELAIAFAIFPEGKFSDGAPLAIDRAKSDVFQSGWLDRVFPGIPQSVGLRISARHENVACSRKAASRNGASPVVDILDGS
ncbi:MAG: hypothetical protein OXC72_08770 [Roseovarius sp.]|nr:hypothetical protein [Roseovarius sp.]